MDLLGITYENDGIVCSAQFIKIERNDDDGKEFVPFFVV